MVTRRSFLTRSVEDSPLFALLRFAPQGPGAYKKAPCRFLLPLLHAEGADKAHGVDGEDDCGGLDEVLRKLKKNNLLHRHETAGPETSPSAQKQLQSIATQSGGNYHKATSIVRRTTRRRWWMPGGASWCWARG